MWSNSKVALLCGLLCFFLAFFNPKRDHHLENEHHVVLSKKSVPSDIRRNADKALWYNVHLLCTVRTCRPSDLFPSTTTQPDLWHSQEKEIIPGICVRFGFCCRTEALAKVCLFVDEDFGRDHISERHEHLQYVLVSKLLGQVVDEQVGTFRTWGGGGVGDMQSRYEVSIVFPFKQTCSRGSAALWLSS